MPFAKLSTRYINVDTITHLDFQANAEGEVTSATVYFLSGHQDSLSLAGEDARALVAAIDPPKESNRGYSGAGRGPR